MSTHETQALPSASVRAARLSGPLLLLAGFTCCALFGCADGGVAPGPTPSPSASPTPVALGIIEVDNVGDNETVNAQFLVVTGRLRSGGSQVHVRVGDTTGHQGDRAWRVHDGRFKCIVPLVSGANEIDLSAAQHEARRLSVRYVPRTTSHTVRIVYVMASDDDGSFQSVVPGAPTDRETAMRRLRFGGLLIESSYAEMLRTAGYGRRTFRLARDPGGEVSITCVRLDETREELHRHRYWRTEAGEWRGADSPYSASDLWVKIYRKVDQLWPGDTTKVLAYIAFSRQDAVNEIEYAVATLGGGKLGTQNSLRLYAYPENLEQLEALLYDTRKESDHGLMGTDTFGQAWGTHLGGAAHELGHAFGLAHHSEWSDLMGGGFYSFSLLFAPVRGDLSVYPPTDVPFLADRRADGAPHATLLTEGPWFVSEQ